MKKAHCSALCVAMGLWGCGDGSIDDSGLGPATTYPVPGCEAFDATPCDVRASDCQTRLFAIASCLHGDEPSEPPPVSMFTEAEYTQYLNDLFSSEPVPEPYYERALNLLGLVQPGALGLQATVETQVENVAGFYRDEEKDIFLIDHGQASDADAASAILVHEYIHALQDRVVGLSAFRQEHANSYDSFLAIDSVVEGEARLHETRYVASAIGLNPVDLDWQGHFQAALERSEADVLADPSPYLATWREFPYRWGARYLHFVWQAGGMPAVLERYAMPPTTTSVLMASVDGAVAQDFTPVVVNAPVPDAGWTLKDETVLGAWGTFLILALIAAPDAARPAALGWRGDGLWVYASGSAQTAAVWRVEFADETSAVNAETILRLRFPTGLERQGTRVVLMRVQTGESLDWAFAP